MIFTVSSATLSSCLQALSRVLNSKSSLPILDSFLFDVANNVLTITASDGENVVTSSIDLVDSSEEFSFCLYNKTIIDAVKEFADEPLSFDINMNDLSATIKYHNGQNRIPVQSSETYPRINANSEELTTTINIGSSQLEKAITRSLFATTSDELRPVMNGLYFDLKTDSLTIVASDGHKLVRNVNHEIVGNEPASFILPKKPATLLKNLLPKDGNVAIKFNKSTAVIEFEKTVMVCRLIEGRYPNYNSVIPQNNPNELTIDRQALLTSLRRVLVFAASSCLVGFRLENNKLILSSEDIDLSKSANEELNCEYYGQQMSIGFKGTSLVEILSNIDAQEVVFKLADPSRAGVLVPATQSEKEDLLMLVMPMMLND